MIALFRISEARKGSIVIDGIDIAEVSRQLKPTKHVHDCILPSCVVGGAE